MDPREAVDRTLAGQPDAFGALVKQYEGALFACALARVYDREDARDLCQETFLRAYQSLRTLKDRDAFGPWLFMILRRLCVDFLRGKWRRIEGERKMDIAETEVSPDPRATLCSDDTAQKLWRLVGQLDEKSREILALYYGQQLKVREIAALTNMGESAVKMRLKKARFLLGRRAEELQGAWAHAAMPSLTAATMGLVKTAAPAKAAPLALGPLWGLLGVLGGSLWMQRKDLDAWRPHIPGGVVVAQRRRLLWSLVYIAAVLCVMRFLPVLKAHIPYFDVCCVVAVLGYCGIGFKRGVDLMRPSQKALMILYLAVNFLLLFLCVKFIVPGKAAFFVYFGLLLLLQGIFFKTTHAGMLDILPGVWLMPVLKHARATTGETRPVSMARVKPWLTMLHELGLVTPPCKKDENGITVQLRLRARFWSRIAWGISYSTLRAETSGVVACEIVPGDYIALAKQFGPEGLPGRRELADELGRRCTAACAVYAGGGDRDAVAACLGLSECPIDARRTHTFRYVTYASLVFGIISIAAGLFLRS